jgi:hypothetical protein
MEIVATTVEMGTAPIMAMPVGMGTVTTVPVIAATTALITTMVMVAATAMLVETQEIIKAHPAMLVEMGTETAMLGAMAMETATTAPAIAATTAPITTMATVASMIKTTKMAKVTGNHDNRKLRRRELSVSA